MSQDLITASKFMSLVLRHKPETIGLMLDSGGWTLISELAQNSDGRLSDELIRHVVETSDKQRFAVSADGQRIRANQGHSIDINLGYEERQPPEVLFHGTAKKFIPSIRVKGLIPGQRQHVHLSLMADTARTVGARHGSPVVLEVLSQTMALAGHVFYRSDNGVWLTTHVPTQFIQIPPASSDGQA